MGKIAFVFPGQGAQAVGMGKDVYEAVPAAQEAFDTAEQVLGFPLKELVFNGPEEDLKQTANTQPALLVTSYALYRAFEASGVRPDFVAGHSLGEYSALVVAGVRILRGCSHNCAAARTIHGAGCSAWTRCHGGCIRCRARAVGSAV